MRIAPKDVEIEKTILGALLLEKEALHEVADILKPETFYAPAHQKIYEAILALFHKNEEVDLHTLVSQLRKQNRLEEIGGLGYLLNSELVVPLQLTLRRMLGLF